MNVTQGGKWGEVKQHYLPARGKTQSSMKNKEHAEAGARPSIVAYIEQILSYSNIRM